MRNRRPRLRFADGGPAPAPVFREGVNVLPARTEEIQKVHAQAFAGFDANARSCLQGPLNWLQNSG